MTQTAQQALSQADLLAQVSQLDELEEDFTQVAAGGGRRLLEEGYYIGRLAQVTEWGKHAQVIKGKYVEPAQLFKLGFELFSTKGQWVNPDQTPELLETFDLKKSRNEKAGAFKLFKEMNYLGTAKSFPGLLAQQLVYVIKVENKGTQANPQDLRSRIASVAAGLDQATGQQYACPPSQNLHLFSWLQPTLQAWDAMFIEGTNDKGDSKNFKQERIVGAVDFPGSPLEKLLMENGRTIPAARPQPTAQNAAGGVAAPAAGVAAPGVAAPAVAPVVAPAAAVAAPAPVVPVAVAPVAVAPVAAVPVVAPVVEVPAA